MQVELRREPGRRNDLVVRLPREEIDQVLLHVAHRERLMRLSGLTRHRSPMGEEREQNAQCKVPVEEHLRELGLLDQRGHLRRRVLAVGNRNLGNNHGFVAWQSDQKPAFFSIKDDPLNYPAYSCLVMGQNGELSIQDLCFNSDGSNVLQADTKKHITQQVRWASFGHRVLRAGRAVAIEDIIDQFYDIRHVLAFDMKRPEGKRVQEYVFENYPDEFRQRALDTLADWGVPRNRFLHNAIGLSQDDVIIVQREGTPEEVAYWLAEAGAEDGLILDNGGSVACWASWLHPHGGFLFTAPDYRPPGTAIIAFVLRGPLRVDLPRASVSYAVV